MNSNSQKKNITANKHRKNMCNFTSFGNAKNMEMLINPVRHSTITRLEKL